jgi:hypothetical protein
MFSLYPRATPSVRDIYFEVHPPIANQKIGSFFGLIVDPVLCSVLRPLGLFRSARAKWTRWCDCLIGAVQGALTQHQFTPLSDVTIVELRACRNVLPTTGVVTNRLERQNSYATFDF